MSGIPTGGIPTRGISWGAFDPAALLGASDPYTLTPLLAGERVTYCARCMLGYHAETMAFLRQQNAGLCVGCQRVDRLAVVVLPGGTARAGKEAPAPLAAPPLVTLPKIRDHVGQVVDFEGYVHQSYQARTSGTWFVKFERTPRPIDGFRLVIYSDYAKRWTLAGISPQEYEGQTVRVHGLIQDHPRWGIDMVIDRPDLVTPVEHPAPRQRIIWKAGGA